jgi:hypothetical protein
MWSQSRAIFLYGGFMVVTAAAAIVIGACSSGVGPDGPVVGSACEEQLDCADGSVCLLEMEDFPDGMCGKACKTQADCPEETACVDVQGGFCLLSCSGTSSCRAGIACRAKRNKDDSLESDVCINDDG